MDYFLLFFRELKLMLMRSHFGLGVEGISQVAANGALREEKITMNCLHVNGRGGSSASVDIMPDCL